MLTKEAFLKRFENGAHLLDCALYSSEQPALARAQADAFAAQIRSIAAPPLIKTAKDR